MSGLDFDNQILVECYHILIPSQFKFSKALWNSLFHLMSTAKPHRLAVLRFGFYRVIMHRMQMYIQRT